ncbi:hypothetical protein MIR68_009498 [Amoeboaphelidium protococcarum]|nr:hypothetical protein MIR68_009498 [Amoeboaphelidium protococcarum]
MGKYEITCIVGDDRQTRQYESSSEFQAAIKTYGGIMSTVKDIARLDSKPQKPQFKNVEGQWIDIVNEKETYLKLLQTVKATRSLIVRDAAVVSDSRNQLQQQQSSWQDSGNGSSWNSGADLGNNSHGAQNLAPSMSKSTGEQGGWNSNAASSSAAVSSGGWNTDGPSAAPVSSGGGGRGWNSGPGDDFQQSAPQTSVSGGGGWNSGPAEPAVDVGSSSNNNNDYSGGGDSWNSAGNSYSQQSQQQDSYQKSSYDSGNGGYNNNGSSSYDRNGGGYGGYSQRNASREEGELRNNSRGGYSNNNNNDRGGYDSRGQGRDYGRSQDGYGGGRGDRFDKPQNDSAGYGNNDGGRGYGGPSGDRFGGAPGGGQMDEPPARARPSDSLVIGNASSAVRSDEYTEERDSALEEQIFNKEELDQRTPGINFSKYENIKAKVTGKNAPSPISNFEELGLHKHVLENIRKCKYKVPTPVQKYGIPVVMSGRDMMACAQTGSGKTASFLVPIINEAIKQGLNRASNRPAKGEAHTPFCLVIAPTRELAIQIFKEACKFSFSTGIRACVVYGGQPGSLQYLDMEKGCDLLVGTPGRIQDFTERGIISYQKLKWLVIDEADRMLDMGFELQLRKLMENRDFPDKTNRQTLMWSATFPNEIQQLAASFLKEDYLFLAVGRVGAACDNVKQTIKLVDDYKKRSELVEMLSAAGRMRVLIFVASKASADRLDDFLFNQGFPCTSIHGDRTQMQREQALESFRRAHTPILIATDVASRGLDIPDVHHVVIFDMPKNLEDYVHRIGRTGRAGNTGMATAFFTNNDASLASDLMAILEEAGQEVPSFLRDMSGGASFGGYGGGGGRSGGNDFGGRDVRNSRW